MAHEGGVAAAPCHGAAALIDTTGLSVMVLSWCPPPNKSNPAHFSMALSPKTSPLSYRGNISGYLPSAALLIAFKRATCATATFITIIFQD